MWLEDLKIFSRYNDSVIFQYGLKVRTWESTTPFLAARPIAAGLASEELSVMYRRATLGRMPNHGQPSKLSYPGPVWKPRCSECQRIFFRNNKKSPAFFNQSLYTATISRLFSSWPAMPPCLWGDAGGRSCSITTWISQTPEVLGSMTHWILQHGISELMVDP